jgi:hypothetical protein
MYERRRRSRSPVCQGSSFERSPIYPGLCRELGFPNFSAVVSSRHCLFRTSRKLGFSWSGIGLHQQLGRKLDPSSRRPRGCFRRTRNTFLEFSRRRSRNEALHNAANDDQICQDFNKNVHEWFETIYELCCGRFEPFKPF